MAQKQIEERMEANEKQLLGMKELVVSLCWNIEKLRKKFVRSHCQE